MDYKPIYSKNNQNFGIKIRILMKNKSNKKLANQNYSKIPFVIKKNNENLNKLKLLKSENKLILSKDSKGQALLLELKINLKILI